MIKSRRGSATDTSTKNLGRSLSRSHLLRYLDVMSAIKDHEWIKAVSALANDGKGSKGKKGVRTKPMRVLVLGLSRTGTTCQ